MTAKSSSRLTHLDGLRGLAAFIVVIHHTIIDFDFALFTGAPDQSLFSWDIPLSGAPFLLPLQGNFSVAIFFVLSGYVLANSFSKTMLGMPALLIKRYVRLMLPILFVCLVSYGLLSSGLMRNHELAAISKSSHLDVIFQQTPSLFHALQEGLYRTFIEIVPAGETYDTSLWTMPIEFFGSIGLILIFGLTRRTDESEVRVKKFRIRALVLCAIVFYGSYLGLFACGALIYLTWGNRKIETRTALALIAAGLFLGTVPYSAVPWKIVEFFTLHAPPVLPWLPYRHSHESFYHALGALMIMVTAHAWMPFRRFLSTPFWHFMGNISFPLYLIHVPLLASFTSLAALSMLHAGVSYGMTMLASLLLELMISVAAAVLLFYAVERPTIRLSQKIAARFNRIGGPSPEYRPKKTESVP